jgi:sialate O-acetylesterase
LACLSISAPAAAAVTLPSLFSDHMVVQRSLEVPIWGTDTANQSITVKLGAQQATGKAGADGKWTVRLPAQDAGGPLSMTVTGSSTVTVADVYVGEVWIGSGQSNMDYRVRCTFAGCGLNNEAAEIAAANYPLIRFANIPWSPSATPRDASAVKTSWSVTSPTTVPNFSAAGYFFSRELAKAMPGVAIGFILGSFGASTLQCWMSKASLQAIPSVATLLAQFEASPDYTNQHNPYICYNGQIAPLIPYAIRGVIWYQGESVTWGGNTYRDLQVGQVNSWRQAWGQDFTFLIAQLPNYNVSSSGWPVLREAQLQTIQIVPNAGLAVTIDIGVPTYVHPPDKQDVGLRFGLLAEAITYGQEVADYGPLYDHMAIEGSSIRLSFTHTEAGMAFKGGTATGFEIAGADGTYSTATAVIQPDSTILVSSPSVTAPKNARYCWAGNPTPTLFSQGTPALPASPFRTDPPALPPGTITPDAGVVGGKDSGAGDAAVIVLKDSGVVTGGAGGNTGSAGSTGLAGNSGSAGNTGSGGKTNSGGITNVGGTISVGGTTSSGGSTSAAGNAGLAGNAGAAGSAGSAGNLGSAGNTGPTPSAGAGGNTGAAGNAGSGGNAGLAGNTGPATSAGSGGKTGSAGNTGADAAVAAVDAARATGGTSRGGCSYCPGDRATGLLDSLALVLGVLLVLGSRRIRRRLSCAPEHSGVLAAQLQQQRSR